MRCMPWPCSLPRAEIDTGKVRRVFGQLLAAGKELVKVVMKG